MEPASRLPHDVTRPSLRGTAALLATLIAACGARSAPAIDGFDGSLPPRRDGGEDAGVPHDGGPDARVTDAGPDARVDGGCVALPDGCAPVDRCGDGANDDFERVE